MKFHNLKINKTKYCVTQPIITDISMITHQCRLNREGRRCNRSGPAPIPAILGFRIIFISIYDLDLGCIKTQYDKFF